MSKMISVRTVIHTVALGSCLLHQDVCEDIPEEELNMDELLEKLEDSIKVDGRYYKYHDRIFERFTRNGNDCVVIYLRYLLDTEMFNFNNFLASAMPGDAMMDTTGQINKKLSSQE